MIKRILEPEVMDSVEEAFAYDTMDHHVVNVEFVHDLIATGYRWQGSVLDVGTGTARIPIVLCEEIADVRIVGIDLSKQMLVLAEKNIRAAQLGERIQVKKLDAKKLPFQDALFENCVSNSIAHHIPSPAQVLSEAVRVTCEGGILFWRDLVRPESDTRLRHLVQTYAGHENVHQQQLFADSLHAALSLEEVRSMVAELNFDPAGVSMTSDRHWTWSTKK